MKNKLFVPFVLVVVLLAGAKSFGDEADEKIIKSTIELARSYLGDSDKLDSIDSISYKGSLLYSTGDLGTIDMVYQKPMRHHLLHFTHHRRHRLLVL